MVSCFGVSKGNVVSQQRSRADAEPGTHSTELVLAALGGYLLGMAPAALVVGRWYGIDPRTAGDGNPGASNLWKLVGARAGIATLVLDMGKGATAARWGLRRGGWWTGIAATLGAMVGHAWPAWSGFRSGGRSVAVFVGAGTALAPRSALISWMVCLGTLPLGKPKVSITAGLLTYPLAYALSGHERRLIGLGLAYLLLAHRQIRK